MATRPKAFIPRAAQRESDNAKAAALLRRLGPPGDWLPPAEDFERVMAGICRHGLDPWECEPCAVSRLATLVMQSAAERLGVPEQEAAALAKRMVADHEREVREGMVYTP